MTRRNLSEEDYTKAEARVSANTKQLTEEEFDLINSFHTKKQEISNFLNGLTMPYNVPTMFLYPLVPKFNLKVENHANTYKFTGSITGSLLREYTWLDLLKAGDKVVYKNSRTSVKDSIKEVLRTTKNFIILKGMSTRKFRKEGGLLAGNESFYVSWIDEATPEKIAEITISEKEVRNGTEN